jgi:hypothetical protein
MKITRKHYRCPTCGNMSMHDTNHFGEIYCQCKGCGSHVLYCYEAEAIVARKQQETSHAIIHWYDYRLPEKYGESVEPFTQYHALKKGLTDLGFLKFKVIVPYSYRTALKAHVGEKITVYDRYHFSEQFVTSVGRLHNWQEFYWENPLIREGYWLEFS